MELLEAITGAILQLFEWFEDDEDKVKDVPLAIIEIIGNLANHGESQSNIAAQLTRIAKSSFTEPSRTQFRHSSSFLKTMRQMFGG